MAKQVLNPPNHPLSIHLLNSYSLTHWDNSLTCVFVLESRFLIPYSFSMIKYLFVSLQLHCWLSYTWIQIFLSVLSWKSNQLSCLVYCTSYSHQDNQARLWDSSIQIYKTIFVSRWACVWYKLVFMLKFDWHHHQLWKIAINLNLLQVFPQSKLCSQEISSLLLHMCWSINSSLVDLVYWSLVCYPYPIDLWFLVQGIHLIYHRQSLQIPTYICLIEFIGWNLNQL